MKFELSVVKKIIPLPLFLLTQCASNETYIPYRLGHRMSLCGQIVDEHLVPVKDTLVIEQVVNRPLMTLKGQVKQHAYRDTIRDSRFCIGANFAVNLKAVVTGSRIVSSAIYINDVSHSARQFKWVVERRPRPLRQPKLVPITLTSDSCAPFHAFSLWSDVIPVNRSHPIRDTLNLGTSSLIFSSLGVPFNENDLDAGRMAWMRKFYQAPREVRGYYPREPLLEYPDTWNLTGFHLAEHADSLYFKAGPHVRPRFASATLDSPACYFGRMADPPPKESPLWHDSLLVAVRDSVVRDGFYLYLPWSDTWGKAILDSVVRRDKLCKAVPFMVVFEPYGKTDSFEFEYLVGNSLRLPFHARRRCHTQAEKLVRDVYPTRFQSPGRSQ